MSTETNFAQITEEYVRALRDCHSAHANAMQSEDESTNEAYANAMARVDEVAERWRATFCRPDRFQRQA